jgi:hypothetical protein
MINRNRTKIIIAVLFLAAISVALYMKSQKSTWDSGWDNGLLSLSERNYYSNRIKRLIKNWQQTARETDVNKEDILPESYQTYLIIDLEKKAFWLEENGKIRTENYIALSAKTNWSLYHITPGGHTEISGLTALKIRGINLDRIAPERFYLVGQGPKGYLIADFNMHSENTGYNVGPFVMRTINFQAPIVSADKIYPSIIATNDGYKQYHDTLPGTNTLVTENESIKAWNKIEKYLYMEIEKQIRKTGYRFGNFSIEPGPDFSAARALINVRKENFIEKITRHRTSIVIYQNIDYLSGDNWYAKSVSNPYSDSKDRLGQPLELEFLVSSNGIIKGSQRRDLLKKGREFQQAASIPESKWKAILSDGTTIELLGICESPSVGQQWWGPDGSLLDFPPYINTEPYRIYEDRKIYEMAWRVTPQHVIPFIFEGSMVTFHHHPVSDRYGYSVIPRLATESFSFEKSRQTTSFKIGFGNSDWMTALQIKNEAGEIKFLDQYRVIIKPPTIKDGKIVIHCFNEFSTLLNYITDFAIDVIDGSTTTTISLERYISSYTDRRDTGLTERIFNIQDLDISQIKGVCFRYRPYGVIFKNISLVPGKNQGFEIVQEAQEK